MKKVHFDTDKGEIVAELFEDDAPGTVANFVGLATGTKEWTDPKTGKKVSRPFYDGLSFHRVIADFVIQGGCPLGTGTGGPGFKIKCETERQEAGPQPGVALDGARGQGHRRVAVLHLPLAASRTSTASTRSSARSPPGWTWSTASRSATR